MPNFLIIGAAKSGTTALYEFLRQHPKVFMSSLKEPNFFAFEGRIPDYQGPDDPTQFNRDVIHTLHDYRALFNGVNDETAIGEASTRYMDTPGSAERIRRHLPSARLVAILRHPADRAYSEYLMRVRDGVEPPFDFEGALRREPQRIRDHWSWGWYVQRGCYHRQLRPYFDLFPRNQMRVLLHEDLIEDPFALIRDIFGFLGVDDDFAPVMSRSINVSGVIRNPLLRTLWTKSRGMRRTIRPVLTKSVRQRVSRFIVNREMTKMPFPPRLREALVERFRPDILQLQELIGRDLSHWLN